jgi:hypothetical protein
MITEKIDKKAPYEKPQVSHVKFVVDEMVFANCKLASGSGGRNPTYACWVSWWTAASCNASGS